MSIVILSVTFVTICTNRTGGLKQPPFCFLLFDYTYLTKLIYVKLQACFVIGIMYIHRFFTSIKQRINKP